MCDGEKVRHAWIYGGMCEIRPPVYMVSFHWSLVRPDLHLDVPTLHCAAPGRVWSIGAWAVPKLVCPTEVFAASDVSTHWAWAAPGPIYSYTVSQYITVRLLDVSTLQGHELHSNIPWRQKPVFLLDLSTQQRPVPLTNMSSHCGLTLSGRV
jgi:hypothetical protein